MPTAREEDAAEESRQHASEPVEPTGADTTAPEEDLAPVPEARAEDAAAPAVPEKPTHDANGTSPAAVVERRPEDSLQSREHGRPLRYHPLAEYGLAVAPFVLGAVGLANGGGWLRAIYAFALSGVLVVAAGFLLYRPLTKTRSVAARSAVAVSFVALLLVPTPAGAWLTDRGNPAGADPPASSPPQASPTAPSPSPTPITPLAANWWPERDVYSVDSRPHEVMLNSVMDDPTTGSSRTSRT